MIICSISIWYKRSDMARIYLYRKYNSCDLFFRQMTWRHFFHNNTDKTFLSLIKSLLSINIFYYMLIFLALSFKVEKCLRIRLSARLPIWLSVHVLTPVNIRLTFPYVQLLDNDVWRNNSLLNFAWINLI